MKKPNQIERKNSRGAAWSQAKKRIRVPMPVALKEAVQKAAKASGQSVSAFVEDAIRGKIGGSYAQGSGDTRLRQAEEIITHGTPEQRRKLDRGLNLIAKLPRNATPDQVRRVREKLGISRQVMRKDRP